MAMKFRACFVFVVCLLTVCLGTTQTQPTEQELKNRLSAQFLVVRGMYNGSLLSFDAQGNLLGTSGTAPFGASALRVDRVRLQGDMLKIRAMRCGLVFSGGTDSPEPGEVHAVPLKGQKVTIMIARDAAHPEGVDAALGNVFSIGIDEKLASTLPGYWQPWVHRYLHPDQPVTAVAAVAAMFQMLKEHPEIKPPRLIRAPDPAFSAAAKARKFQGMAVLGLMVDRNGDPQDIFIRQPLGMGLDEEAVRAVSQYKFKAAMKDGEPIEVGINIQVNFRIY
ncbi:MAG: energy transducer TonB [Acidobacteriaceae bacterium]